LDKIVLGAGKLLLKEKIMKMKGILFRILPE